MNSLEARIIADKVNMFSARMEDTIVLIMVAAQQGEYYIIEDSLSEGYVKVLIRYGYAVTPLGDSRFKISW